MKYNEKDINKKRILVEAVERTAKWLNVSPKTLMMNLTRATSTDGWKVCHDLASQGVQFNEDDSIIYEKDNRDWTVAHVMAMKGYSFPEDHPILKEKDNDGWSVAHQMAAKGYHFHEDDQIVYQTDEYGYTVAHFMARTGYRFSNSEILKLTNEEGWSVADEMKRYTEDFSEQQAALK